jgi:hypothetical protein
MRRTAVLFVAVLFITPYLFSQLSFTQHSYLATGTRLLRADFNNDGKPDLLVYGGSELEVLLNNGDGTFGAPISVPMTGGTPFAVALDYTWALSTRRFTSPCNNPPLHGKGLGASPGPLLHLVCPLVI